MRCESATNTNEAARPSDDVYDTAPHSRRQQKSGINSGPLPKPKAAAAAPKSQVHREAAAPPAPAGGSHGGGGGGQMIGVDF
jgi:hypothetical protein